jgi:hypothetical protein
VASILILANNDVLCVPKLSNVIEYMLGSGAKESLMVVVLEAAQVVGKPITSIHTEEVCFVGGLKSD